jgi:hypothetical protein
MLAQSQRLRRLAAFVLLLWASVLATGVVHACMVQTQLQHAVQSVAEGQSGGTDAGEVDCHHAAGNESTASRPPCERLCDGPSAVPQAEKHLANPLGGFWLACAPIPSFVFQSAPQHSRTTIHSAHDRWRTAIPISIAFLRLAL